MKKFIALTAAFVLALGCTAYAQDKPYKEDMRVGDVNDDGKVDAADSTEIMQKTLSGGYVLACEKYYNYMGIADIDANGVINTQDAALALQKTLSNAFDMTALRNKKILTVKQLFSAAQTYVTDYYAMNGKNPPDVVPEKLVELEFISEVPAGNCKIELDENFVGAVKRVTLDGLTYPDDRYIYASGDDHSYDFDDKLNAASTLFSAAQTYVTDYYVRYGKNPEKVTVEDLYAAKLLKANSMCDDAQIVIDGKVPAVQYVIVKGICYPEFTN